MAKCQCLALARQVNYVIDRDKNFERLVDGLKDLYVIRRDIQEEMVDPLSVTPSLACQAWLQEADKIENQGNAIKSAINANRRSLCQFRKLGKQICTLLNSVSRLKEISTVLLDGQTSTQLLIRRLLRFIRDDKIYRIGLWGRQGAGKTRVLKILSNLLEIKQTFEIVIWMTVLSDGSVRRVQNEIAQQLQIDVARKISRTLENLKYLLLLDDMFIPLDLTVVGVPMPNRQVKSKIVLTTGDRNVCHDMETDEEIMVEFLSQKEAFSLFCKKVGDVVTSPGIKPFAVDIVKECAGWPLVVLVIGGLLMKRVTDLLLWRNTLEGLRSASHNSSDAEEELYKILMLSYVSLDEHLQNCFLYCALYPEDFKIPIAELVEHWRAEGFVEHWRAEGFDDDLQSSYMANDKAHSMLRCLLDGSLLEETDGNCVKMHGVVRDFALRRKGKWPKFLVRAGVGIKECPNVEEWEETHRISLIETHIRSLPARPRCTSLSTLLLQSSGWQLKTIPELFFEHMHNLRVLNLCQTRIGSLPSSISRLVNLRGLYMIGSDSVDLPSEIGALGTLEALYICPKSLPSQVRRLTRLMRLRLQFKSEQVMRSICDEGVLSSLKLLEEFKMYISDWDLIEKWCGMVNARVAEEVGGLRHLTSLQFEFSKTKWLEQFLEQRERLNCPQLRDFSLSASDAGRYFSTKTITQFSMSEEGMTNVLTWGMGDTLYSRWIAQVLNKAHRFDLCDHETARSLSDFGMQNISRLETCTVLNCREVENIVDGSGSSTWPYPVLPNLKRLELSGLPNLRSICRAPPCRFSNLTTMEIRRCSKLKCVFTIGMIQHMPNLEQLSVWECEAMKEIVAEEKSVNDDIKQVFFPKLKEFELWGMENLERIWRGASQPWPSLQKMTVARCSKLKYLNLSEGAFQLGTIQGDRNWWAGVEWEYGQLKDRFESHFQHVYY